MSVCVPMASMVTRAPFRSRCLSNNVAQIADPGQQAGFEQLRVPRRKHVAQRIVAGDAVFVASEERQMLPLPQRHLDEVVRPAMVADKTRSRISGKGYRTLPC
jgi:hypothetical protein